MAEVSNESQVTDKKNIAVAEKASQEVETPEGVQHIGKAFEKTRQDPAYFPEKTEDFFIYRPRRNACTVWDAKVPVQTPQIPR